MTYSEIVHFLSTQQVPASPDNPILKVTLLEKFVTSLGLDFDQIELEMNLKEDGFNFYYWKIVIISSQMNRYYE